MNQEISGTEIKLGTSISPKLYSDIAEKYAREISESGDPRERDRLNKPSQLRRIYDELILLQTRVGSSTERFEQLLPFIQMLKAKAAYARGRKKITTEFESMLRTLVDQVIDIATLAQAKLFLEAFMAYYKVYKHD